MKMEMEKIIERIKNEGERYRITNEKLYEVCYQIEELILQATPENFTCNLTGDFGDFEIFRFNDYDAGLWRDFRYIRYDGDVLTKVWFNDIRIGTKTGYREQRIKFLKNLDKILAALVAELQTRNVEATQALNKIKIVE